MSIGHIVLERQRNSYQLVLNLSECVIDRVHDVVDIHIPVTQLLAPELTRGVEFVPEAEVTWPHRPPARSL